MILCGGSDPGELKCPEHDFKYLYWTISKFYLQGNIHDWLGRADSSLEMFSVCMNENFFLSLTPVGSIFRPLSQTHISKALSHGAIPKLNFLVSWLISVFSLPFPFFCFLGSLKTKNRKKEKKEKRKKKLVMKHRTVGASDTVKAESSGEDTRAAEGHVSGVRQAVFLWAAARHRSWTRAFTELVRKNVLWRRKNRILPLRSGSVCKYRSGVQT